MGGETFGPDVGCETLDASAGSSHIEHREEDDDPRSDKRTLDELLGLLRRAVLLRIELADEMLR